MTKTIIPVLSLLLFFFACKKADIPAINNSGPKADKVFSVASPCGSPVSEAWFQYPVTGKHSGSVVPTILTIDKDGNLLTFGYYSGKTTFSDPLHSVTLDDQGYFLMKTGADGKLIWCEKLTDCLGYGKELLISPAGNIYLSYTYGIPLDPDAYSIANGLGIIKINPNGNIAWSIRQPLGGGGGEQCGNMVLDNDESLYIYGFYRDHRNDRSYTFECDLDPGPGKTVLPQTTSFIEKFGADGKFLGVKATGIGNASILNISKNGNVYISRPVYGVVDIDPGPGVYNLGLPGIYSAILYKLDPYENFKWAVDLEAPSDYGRTIGINPNNFHLDKNENICALVSNNLSVIAAGGQVVDKKTVPLEQSHITGIDNYGNFYVSYTSRNILNIIKYDRSANKVWSVAKVVDTNLNQGVDGPVAMSVGPNGDIYIVADRDLDDGTPTFYLIKYSQCNGGN